MKKLLLFFGSMFGLLVTPKVEYLWRQIKVYLYTGMVRRRYKHFGSRTFLQPHTIYRGEKYISLGDYVSIGDYVLTGGELPAMMMIDCISRLVPGVLNNNVSAEFETFHDNLLEYPQYTRPEVFMGKKVPDILLSGHHANVEKWRREQSIIRTLKNRPELLEDAVLSKKEQKFLDELLRQQETEKP